MNNTCHNMIFDQNAMRGDWTMYLAPGSYTGAAEIQQFGYHFSSCFGNDQIVLCADPSDGDPFLYQSAQLTNSLFVCTRPLALCLNVSVCVCVCACGELICVRVYHCSMGDR